MNINRVRRDISVIADQLEVPGIGFLPVNAFVLHASQPVVVDTGLSLPDRRFVETISAVIDPADVEWIWLTHPDRDHTGGLFDLLTAAPKARVITTFIGAGIMSTERPLPLNRVHLLNPGQSIDVGDRRLTALRPPLFDNPATVGFYDHSNGALFSSDCFGSPMPTAEAATADNVGAVPSADLRSGQLLWASVDSPWVHAVDRNLFHDSLAPLHAMNPEFILSNHLPAAVNRTEELLRTLSEAPSADAFVGPDQAALEQMLASFEPSPVSVPPTAS
ncbi:MBL fold metallo-hydrolase [Saccharothrix deserti]|uniref:MBL fold metallo-hydrolase n=1 Tax=Saccharothrix deserti TaxID=2593674 RepID=UPI00131C401E|nr:MBL fold metallo-hydrolase [Saccharothrix deserti]